MTQREVIVNNHLGIHARPASLIVQTSAAFNADIWLEKDGTAANAKSIMSVMMLAASCDSKVLIRAAGKDEEKAVEAIVKLFENKFNEA
jgi:phosphocarrier protein HPr